MPQPDENHGPFADGARLMSGETVAMKELLERRLDGLAEQLHLSSSELQTNQKRLEREFSLRLDRIEDQTTRHNGRMDALERQHIKDSTLREERERVAREREIERRRQRDHAQSLEDAADSRWKGIGPAWIAGSASGLVIIAAAYILERL